MGLLKNDKTLKEIRKYLDNSNYTNKEIGHSLAMSFFPQEFSDNIYDKRYSFEFKHKLALITFKKESYGGVIVSLITALNEAIDENANIPLIDFYKEIGLIEDNRCTKELIASILSMSIVSFPAYQIGNTTYNIKRTDNLELIFPEFEGKNIEHFLNQIDNYKPKTI